MKMQYYSPFEIFSSAIICDSELRLELISILSSESLKTKTFLCINSFYKHLMSNFQCHQLWKLFKIVSVVTISNANVDLGFTRNGIKFFKCLQKKARRSGVRLLLVIFS